MSFHLTTSQAIIRKVGYMASGSMIVASYAALANFCDQAEGIVCAITKNNWASSAAVMPFSAIVEDTVSSLAAMRCIIYNLNNYAQYREAETVLDVLSDEVARNLAALKDIDVRKRCYSY